MREGPVYLAAMLAGAVAVFAYTILRERRDHLLDQHIRQALANVGPIEHHVAVRITATRTASGDYVLWCGDCQTTLLNGRRYNADADRSLAEDAKWHRKAHEMRVIA